MRFTKLSFEELVEEFNNPDQAVEWKLFQLEDIWNILTEGGEEAEKAEKFFRDLLNDNNLDYRLISFCRLASLECIEAETLVKLEEFSKKPENEYVYQMAGEPVI